MPLMPSTDGDASTPPEWSYSGDPSTSDVDQVRFYLQDNDPAVPLLGDLELQFLVDEWLPRHDSLVFVAAVAAERVAAKFAGVVSVTADGVAVNVADLSGRYEALAKRLRQAHKDLQVGGEVDLTNLMFDPQEDFSIAPLTFGVGKDDNVHAGRQDYGSHRRGWDYEDTVRPG